MNGFFCVHLQEISVRHKLWNYLLQNILKKTLRITKH